jgi:hypothetical protein
MLTGGALTLSSCEKPDIYRLAEIILTGNRRDGRVESVNAEFNIKINKDYLRRENLRGANILAGSELDSVPDEINIKIDGELHHVSESRIMHAALNLSVGDFKLPVYIQNSRLYFENNEVTRIILDLLTATGFVDYEVKQMFAGLAYDRSKIIRVNLRDLDLTWFDQYASRAARVFSLSSKLEIRRRDNPRTAAVNELSGRIARFEEITAQVSKQLLVTPGYRYAELRMIIDPENYLHVMAARENGTVKILEPLKLGIRSSSRAAIADDPDAVYMENIIPLRYIMELMGEEVYWAEVGRLPYMISRGYYMFFESDVINSRSYTNLMQILAFTQYSVGVIETGDYLEFRISR